jgi:hypothetical protein
MENNLTQLELVAWRLAGRLPHIDINGTDFTVDLRLQELRETESPWNHIDLTDMETAFDSDGYLFFYDTKKHNIHELDGNLTELPENVVLVELPSDYILDPVAAARYVGYSDDKFLNEFPIQENLKAEVTPLEETFLPKMIAENLQKEKNDIRSGKRGR